MAYTAAYLRSIGLSVVTSLDASGPGHVTVTDIAQFSTSKPCAKVCFSLAFEDAFQSALTKYDSLQAQFADGRSVKDISSALLDELQGDAEFLLHLVGPEEQDMLRKGIQTKVGTAFGEWKKGRPHGGEAKVKAPKKNRTLPLPWASIDAYPEWVMGQIDAYAAAEPDEQVAARRTLEHTLLGKAILSACIKYDGTCFGKLSNGELCGRKEVLGCLCTEYQHTSTASAESCDVEALRQTLAKILDVDVAEACVWGELMCNPNFYGYREQGLADKWVCFGVVASLAKCDGALPQKLKKRGLAHSINEEAAKLRLFMCPALVELLREVGAANVAQDPFQASTHADVVAKGASDLIAGNIEGIVMVYERANGQASLRKWKNSAEGAVARKKEGRLLEDYRANCLRWSEEGKLDSRIADLVEMLRRVAVAETVPAKRGRVRVRDR